MDNDEDGKGHIRAHRSVHQIIFIMSLHSLHKNNAFSISITIISIAIIITNHRHHHHRHPSPPLLPLHFQITTRTSKVWVGGSAMSSGGNACASSGRMMSRYISNTPACCRHITSNQIMSHLITSHHGGKVRWGVYSMDADMHQSSPHHIYLPYLFTIHYPHALTLGSGRLGGDGEGPSFDRLGAPAHPAGIFRVLSGLQ